MSNDTMLRAGAPHADIADQLGVLTDLVGSWRGSGFNLISLPDFDSRPPSTGPKPFRLKLNATRENLDITNIAGSVPNRGSDGQPDIDLFGVNYLQKVADAATNEPLHMEPGFWLRVPPTLVPPNPNETIVRQSAIPHGDSLLAQGRGFAVAGGPQIDDVDSTPFDINGPLLDPEYLKPFTTSPPPPGLTTGLGAAEVIKNPNALLREANAHRAIVNTVVLMVSTKDVGGIVNIPFVQKNANATRLDAIFWIETIQRDDGSQFLQLQYTQTVILEFLGISWPHISVATLVK